MNATLNLADRARRILIERGFAPDCPPQCATEVQAARNVPLAAAPDLTGLLWSSIDNDDSRDLDQIEYAEPAPDNCIRLMLGIADVATFVQTGSAIDDHAWQNTVSLYTPGHTFHMLPEALSTGITSLNEKETRLAVVVDMLVLPSGAVENARIYHALVRNQAKLTYERVADWLERRTCCPELDRRDLQQQLELQLEASDRLIALRREMGALTFSSYEARAVTRNGDVVDLKLVSRNRARDLIESFMIAANVATATFLKSRGLPIIERVVRAPRRWDRIREIAARYQVQLPEIPAPKPLSEFLELRRSAEPDTFRELSLSIVKLLGPGEYVVEYPTGPQTSHFGLALDDYSHSTAPNRRFADLVLQRLLLATTRGEPLPCTGKQLESIASRCTEREDAARKVERLLRKIAAAWIMRDRIGQTFSATVTGATPKGTWVRLHHPPVEGKVVRGEEGLDVGDHPRVRLLSVDPDSGFVDFSRENS